VFAGNPNGNVTAINEGDICIDISTPAIWQASGAGDEVWDQIGAGSITELIAGAGIEIPDPSGPTPTITATGVAIGGLITRAFPFTFDTADLLTGASVYTPTVGDILHDAWIEVDTAWDGVLPRGNFGQFSANQGMLGDFNLPTVDMTIADTDLNGGDGYLTNETQASSLGTINALGSAINGLTVGGGGTLELQTPTRGERRAPGKFTIANPMKILVSKNGGQFSNASSVTGDEAPTLPLTIVTGVNDTFIFTGDGGGGSPETFTMAPGVNADLSTLEATVAAALGSVSGEPFSTYVTPTDNGTELIFTMVGNNGVSDNGNTITEGNGGAAAIGFTGNPDTFAGGFGGDPGSTQGAGVLYLVTSTPL
jgi:hypothetical protein